MNADSAFVIGKSHAVCQDYAIAGSMRNPDGDLVSYAIVADGCSSSPDTDIGARLLAKAAERLIHGRPHTDALKSERFYEQAAQRALDLARLTGLGSAAVDATLLAVYARGDRFIAACYGDGTIVLKSRAGEIDAYSITFAGNCPRYPSLALQPARLNAFQALEDNAKEVAHCRITPSGNKLFAQERTSAAAVEVVSGPIAEFEYALVMTDGIGSVVELITEETGQRVEPVDLTTVVHALSDFKTPTGAFVQRRLSRFCDQCHKQNRRNADDIAVAAIYLGKL
jgi:serine/threonine protein phosphatase PrpC